MELVSRLILWWLDLTPSKFWLKHYAGTRLRNHIDKNVTFSMHDEYYDDTDADYHTTDYIPKMRIVFWPFWVVKKWLWA